jgi:hypothetical protein
MQATKKISSLLFVLAMVLQGCAYQEKKSDGTANTVEQPAPVTQAQAVIDQYALDRLKQMSDKLIASKAFSYHSRSAIDLQSETGQFVTFINEAEVALQRPDKLRVNVSGDLANIQLYFDGANVSAIDPVKNIYASSPPLANIDEMLNFIMTKAHISFPSADILYSDPYAVMTKNLTDATVVGDSTVNAVLTEHFTYREPAIDWEIWIAKGENPLPMRLAMTYKQVENRPGFLVEFADWKLNPKLKAKTFEFKAPADAKQIEFGTYLEQGKKGEL